MSKKLLFSILLAITSVLPSNAQFGFSHEIGAIIGPVSFRSDYGVRENSETNFGNTGIGIGLIHYLNFAYRADCNCYRPETYFNDHFKLRSEISWNKTNLQHYGKWVDKGSDTAQQLRAMQGKTAVTNVGVQLEFFPLSIREFSYSIGKLAPFVSLGAQYSYYKPEAWSEIDRIDVPGVLPTKYIGGVSNDDGSTFSIVSSVGTRYKLTTLSDLMIDLRWQYYFSDWVDGLNPDPTIYKENKANDWNVWLNVGYIYYLD